jgi:Bacterial type II/III secretion system short domain
MTMTCDARRRRTMWFAGAVAGVALAMGQSAWGQLTDCSGPGTKCPTDTPAAPAPNPRVDTRPLRTFYLSNSLSPNEANEITVAIRNTLDPSVRIYLLPSMNALVARATAEQMDQVQKLINELDRPKKAYRLTYTITDIDGGKRIGVQHYSTIAIDGQRTLVKQVSKFPVVTGSYNNASSQTESQVTYLDVGLIFDATLSSTSSGASLHLKVERSSMAEERSGVGPQDPVVRSTSIEGTTLLTVGKPEVLGSLDIPGSTRHLDVDVMIEPLGQ